MNILNNFIAQQNEDLILLTTFLLITRNQFSIINERIIKTLLSIENTQEDNNINISLPNELDSYKQLLAEINGPNEEIIEMTNSSLENIDSSNIFNLETKQVDSLLETSISLQDNI